MVAGRERDHAAAARALPGSRDSLCEGAAKHERKAGRCSISGLRKDFGSRAFGTEPAAQQRRSHGEWRNHARGRIDVGRM